MNDEEKKAGHDHGEKMSQLIRDSLVKELSVNHEAKWMSSVLVVDGFQLPVQMYTQLYIDDFRQPIGFTGHVQVGIGNPASTDHRLFVGSDEYIDTGGMNMIEMVAQVEELVATRRYKAMKRAVVMKEEKNFADVLSRLCEICPTDHEVKLSSTKRGINIGLRDLSEEAAQRVLEALDG